MQSDRRTGASAVTIRVVLGTALAVTAAITAGCGGSAGPEVVVYVAVDRGDSEPILRRFESQSGVRVRALYDAEAAKTTGLVSRLLAETARPKCDVFWNNELVQTLQLADRGVLAGYPSAAAEGIPAGLIDPEARFTGIAARARVIVYNTKHVPAQRAPRSIFELTRPQWRGKVAVADPQFGTTRTHVAALFAVLGPDRAKKFLKDLLDNQVRITDGNAMVKNLVARASPDASPIYVGLTDTDDVLSGQADGQPVEMVYPDQDTIGTLVIPSTVCLVRGAPHPDTARRLIDYLVGVEVESQLAAGRAGFFPVRPASRAAGRLPPPKAMQVDWGPLLEQLEPSSRWTKEHFRR